MPCLKCFLLTIASSQALCWVSSATSLSSFVSTRDLPMMRSISAGQRMMDCPDGSLLGILVQQNKACSCHSLYPTRLHWIQESQRVNMRAILCFTEVCLSVHYLPEVPDEVLGDDTDRLRVLCLGDRSRARLGSGATFSKAFNFTGRLVEKIGKKVEI